MRIKTSFKIKMASYIFDWVFFRLAAVCIQPCECHWFALKTALYHRQATQLQQQQQQRQTVTVDRETRKISIFNFQTHKLSREKRKKFEQKSYLVTQSFLELVSVESFFLECLFLLFCVKKMFPFIFSLDTRSISSFSLFDSFS